MKNPILHVLRHPNRAFAIVRIALLWQKTYFGAQRRTSIEKAILIETPKDDLVKIDENAIYPYLFACFYIVYAAWQLLDKISEESYRKAVDAFEALTLESAEIFENNPTKMKERDRVHHPVTRFVHTIDGPTNCYPSLHVSLMCLSYQILKDEKQISELELAAMKHACIDICRSTMQTKQHSIIDVVGGFAITQKVYESHFSMGKFENFIHEVLIELPAEDLQKIKLLMKQNKHDLASLLNELLKYFR